MWFRILDADRLQNRIHARLETSFQREEKIKQCLNQCKNLSFPSAKRKSEIRPRLKAHIGQNSFSNFYAGFEDFYASGVFVETWNVRPGDTPITRILNVSKQPKSLQTKGCVRVVKEDSGFDDELSPGLEIDFDKLRPSQRNAICNFSQTREPFFYG